MGNNYKYGFRIKHDKAWAWHIGMFFCIHPKDINGHRDIYLFFCIGHHDFTIGFIDYCEDEEYE